MRNFSGLEDWVRKHFFIYRTVRKAAPFLCRFFALEEGFEILRFIEKRKDSFIALDIGANDGTSIRMIQKFQKNAKIVAFDPITRPRFNLRNVDFKEFALSNRLERFSLFTPIVHGKMLTQYSSFHPEKLCNQIEHDLGLNSKDYGIVEKFVEAKPLDLMKLEPFFMKIDVEGAEKSVLEGSFETIAMHLPVILVEIQNDETFILISRELHRHNYVCVSLEPTKNLRYDRVLSNLIGEYRNSQNNYVWIPRESSSSWKFAQ
jgi:FkbM family methyltransferase